MPSQQFRKYICSFCSKAFSRSEHRVRHERSHTGMKPFECKVCRHAFVRRDLLQRHIRTVHRELILRKKGIQQDDENKKSNLMVELLVNSMIKVTKREENGLKGEKAEALSRLIASFLPKASLGVETAGKIFDCGVRCVEKRMHPRLAAQVATQLSGPLSSSVRTQQFRRLCTSSPLVLVIAVLGACVCGESYAGELWQVGWSSCLKTSANVRYVPLNVLVFALLEFGMKPDFGDVFSIYQETCYSVMVENNFRNEEQFFEKWDVFHQWVTLMRFAETQNELTPLLYSWFEKQELNPGDSLKNSITRLDEAENTVAEAIFCNWILGYNSAVPLDKAVELFSNNEGITTTPSHWLLLETAWFEFVKGLESSGFHTSSRIGWFRNCYVRGARTRIQRNCIDVKFMKIILAVFVAMDQGIRYRNVALTADVILFLLRFAEEMDPSVRSANENVQHLICILHRRSGINEQLSFTDLQNGLISYLHGVALALANLPSIDFDVRVPLMVAVQGSSSLPRRSQGSSSNSKSPSPNWLLSPTSACSLNDDGNPRRARSHSGSSIILPPLHVRPSCYAQEHADYVPQGPIATPFTATTITTTTTSNNNIPATPPKMENPNLWPTTSNRFKIKLPPPNELFHIS